MNKDDFLIRSQKELSENDLEFIAQRKYKVGNRRAKKGCPQCMKQTFCLTMELISGHRGGYRISARGGGGDF